MGLKRDWGVFVGNIFDVEVMLRHYAKKGRAVSDPKSGLKEYMSKNPLSINIRPLKSIFLNELIYYYTN